MAKGGNARLMAKRTPRQELRATPKTAPYRREKSTAAPVALELPMPPAPPTVVEAAPEPLPEVKSAPHQAPTTFAALPAELLAVAHSALGFAAAALAQLPAPTQIVHGDPTAPEPPPGRAPAGDSRSLRAGGEFVLIYRHGASVISRRGPVGARGAWRVVDYPGPAPAAHAYALECSRLIEQGFRDAE